MSRFFAPYTDWEDFKAGMWRRVEPEEQAVLLQSAIEFTGNAGLYGKYMLQALIEWPIATRVNMTNPGMNRRAWIGQAACQIAINCPEYITRQAWSYLTREQQFNANAEADVAIKYWETQNNFKKEKHVKELLASKCLRGG